MKVSMDCPLKIKIERRKSISQICNTLATNQKAVRQEYENASRGGDKGRHTMPLKYPVPGRVWSMVRDLKVTPAI
jgi:hypothetical protein